MATTQQAAKGLLLTSENIKDARDGNYFVAVSSKPGSKVAMRPATSYKVIVKNHPDVIYNTNYMVSGTPEDVRAALEHARYSRKEIEAALDPNNPSYVDNSNIFTDPTFKKILNAYKAGKPKASSKKESKFTVEDIVAFAASLSKDKGSKSAKGSGSPRAESLLDKLNKLKNDKVINVSGVDAKGEGYRTIAIPGAGSSLVSGTDGRIVSSKESGLVNALTIMGYTPEEIDVEVAEWRLNAKAVPPKKESPKTSPQKASAKKAPAASRKAAAKPVVSPRATRTGQAPPAPLRKLQ